jgi:GT2 family glycosyltransferase
MSFSIIIVAYHSLLPIKDLYKTIPQSVSVIIVDNSADLELKTWCADKFNITYLKTEENVGFGQACNLGAKYAKSDWLFFLNPDTLLPDNIDEIFKSITINSPNVKIFAPLLVDKSNQINFKKRSAITKPSSNPPRIMSYFSTPIISGAAFFVKKDFFNQLNGFDENIFMYFEDDDLFWRAFQTNKNIFLINDFLVFHAEGGSSPSVADLNAFKSFHWGRSEAYVLIKHKKFMQFIQKYFYYAVKIFLSVFTKKSGKYIGRFYGFNSFIFKKSHR